MKLKYILLIMITGPISIFILAHFGSLFLFKYIGITYEFIEEKSFDCMTSNKAKLVEEMKQLSKKEREKYILKEYTGFSEDKSQFKRTQFGFCTYGGCYIFDNIYDPNIYRFSYINNSLSVPIFHRQLNIDFKETFTCEKYAKYGSLA